MSPRNNATLNHSIISALDYATINYYYILPEPGGGEVSPRTFFRVSSGATSGSDEEKTNTVSCSADLKVYWQSHAIPHSGAVAGKKPGTIILVFCSKIYNLHI